VRVESNLLNWRIFRKPELGESEIASPNDLIEKLQVA
jgi:hypothetical protein